MHKKQRKFTCQIKQFKVSKLNILYAYSGYIKRNVLS